MCSVNCWKNWCCLFTKKFMAYSCYDCDHCKLQNDLTWTQTIILCRPVWLHIELRSSLFWGLCSKSDSHGGVNCIWAGATGHWRGLPEWITEHCQFSQSYEYAQGKIMPCLIGDHSNCGKNSIVCKAKQIFRIPGLSPLFVNNTDRNNLQEVVDYKLHPHMVIKQHKLYTTNRVEAFHHRTFKTGPKNKLMKKSFHARCMAAVLADSLGVNKSIARVAGLLGCRLSRTVIWSQQEIEQVQLQK